jgi:hypothetical protein
MNSDLIKLTILRHDNPAQNVPQSIRALRAAPGCSK